MDPEIPPMEIRWMGQTYKLRGAPVELFGNLLLDRELLERYAATQFGKLIVNIADGHPRTASLEDSTRLKSGADLIQSALAATWYTAEDSEV